MPLCSWRANSFMPNETYYKAYDDPNIILPDEDDYIEDDDDE